MYQPQPSWDQRLKKDLERHILYAPSIISHFHWTCLENERIFDLIYKIKTLCKLKTKYGFRGLFWRWSHFLNYACVGVALHLKNEHASSIISHFRWTCLENGRVLDLIWYHICNHIRSKRIVNWKQNTTFEVFFHHPWFRGVLLVDSLCRPLIPFF